MILSGIAEWNTYNNALQIYKNNILVDDLYFGKRSDTSSQKLGELVDGYSNRYKFTASQLVNSGDKILVRPSYNSNSYFYADNKSKGVAQILLINNTNEEFINKVKLYETSIGLNNPKNSRQSSGVYEVTQNCKLLITMNKYTGADKLVTVSKNDVVVNRYSSARNKQIHFELECSEGDTIRYDFNHIYNSGYDYYSSIVICELPLT